MAQKDTIGLQPGLFTLKPLKNLILGKGRCNLVVHQRWRIIWRDTGVEPPWFMDQWAAHSAQFRHPLADKIPFRVLIMPLFDRGIDAHCVDAGFARLHLAL